MGGFYEDDYDIVALKLSHKQKQPDMLVQMDPKQALRIGSAREGQKFVYSEYYPQETLQQLEQ